MTGRTVICLWFDGTAEDAARLYTGLLPDSRIDSVQHAPADYPAGKAGDVLAVSFTLDGRPYLALNGGPMFAFTEAMSIQVLCDTQAEIDRLWTALSAHPDAESCGWCRDRFGLSWQIIPARLPLWMSGPNAAQVQQAFMPMKKLEIAPLAAAAAG